MTQDDQRKYYFYGAYQCFLLDRFSPGWKRGFLEKGKDLDVMMADLLRLTSAEKERSHIGSRPGMAMMTSLPSMKKPRRSEEERSEVRSLSLALPVMGKFLKIL